MQSAPDWRLVQDLGLELLNESDPEAQVALGLNALLRLIPAEVAGQVEIAERGGTPTVVEVPDLLMPGIL